tara:strand:- start:134 stop:349 length:216 start_codon:yes stop_codon:yes gene_type:complete
MGLELALVAAEEILRLGSLILLHPMFSFLTSLHSSILLFLEQQTTVQSPSCFALKEHLKIGLAARFFNRRR